ncbi:MAG TPA: hypothetical protein VFH10_00510 [Nocardioides sp.]|uniref:hypothetical protein n=1 Tax=Nocardioides sp. TaxID=35761 RepID=UPI002D7FE9E8|nr:hypothetical protein [Nocardioides sp.]HET6651092.1 hypothetical protein [Nocardioides sp.]
MRDKNRSHGPSNAPGTPAPPMPNWVKASLVIAALVAIVVVVAVLTGGEHGPGRHLGGPSLTDTHPVPVAADSRP